MDLLQEPFPLEAFTCSLYIQLGNFVCYKIIVIQDERSNSTPFSLPVKTEPDVYDYQ